MARALQDAKRLAVFDVKDKNSGIELTCGQHVATKKAGNMLYCSTRSMVPVLRNCYVYFEILVMPSLAAVGAVPQQASMMATLSIGLSTGEMPPNTLVGAWQGSVGLCSTGQILMAGNWFSPVDPALASYGDSATVGCLVCMDDGSAFETWDGLMVTASVTFTVNGTVVSPPVSTVTSASRGPLQSAASAQVGLLMGSQQQQPPGDQQAEQPREAPTAVVVPAATLPLLVPSAEDLFPTVTLHSPATSVMCRFSAQDVDALTRESIGAPPGVTVYAIDGSVIFNGET